MGLPLHFKKPSKEMMEVVIQKLGDRLHGWKKNFLSFPDREILIKYVISAMPTYFMAIFKMLKWAFLKMVRIRRSFFCKGKDPSNFKGGQVRVNWQTCLRPKKWDGLGFKDLVELFGSDGCGSIGMTLKDLGKFCLKSVINWIGTCSFAQQRSQLKMVRAPPF
jgi:hypothetical protein